MAVVVVVVAWLLLVCWQYDCLDAVDAHGVVVVPCWVIEKTLVLVFVVVLGSWVLRVSEIVDPIDVQDYEEIQSLLLLRMSAYGMFGHILGVVRVCEDPRGVALAYRFHSWKKKQQQQPLY